MFIFQSKKMHYSDAGEYKISATYSHDNFNDDI